MSHDLGVWRFSVDPPSLCLQSYCGWGLLNNKPCRNNPLERSFALLRCIKIKGGGGMRACQKGIFSHIKPNRCKISLEARLPLNHCNLSVLSNSTRTPTRREEQAGFESLEQSSSPCSTELPSRWFHDRGFIDHPVAGNAIPTSGSCLPGWGAPNQVAAYHPLYTYPPAPPSSYVLLLFSSPPESSPL